MKKPFSIVDSALNVIRVCLVVGIFISIFDFYTRIDQSSAIVIRFPTSSETAEVSGYGTEPASSAAETSAFSVAEPVADITAAAEPVEAIAANVGGEVSVSEEHLYTPETAAQSSSGSLRTSAPAEQPAISAETSAIPAETSAAPASEPAESGLININEASAKELMSLKGIGEVKAAAIVEYRRANGGFRKIEDIMNVKGIGEKTFEKIRDQITV